MLKFLGKFLSKTLPHFIQFFIFRQKEIHLDLYSHLDTRRVLFFLKNSKFTQFKTLIDIVGIDFLNNYNRFELIYSLLSVRYNLRIFIKVYLNEFFITNTISDLFLSSNWSEREVWDMYGIFFKGHNDLRRILNNYGFNGYPLRKDFSLIGYLSVRYDDSDKFIVSEPIEMFQSNLEFIHLKTPWK
jgi:NADH dehydrogenase (ubiquinone) Fe-S protein 3